MRILISVMDIRRKFGNKIRDIRQLKGMSQEDLAFALEMRPSTLSSLELGKSFVSYRTLVNLCDILDVSPKTLFDFNSITPDSVSEEIIKEIDEVLPELDIIKLKYLHKITRIFADKD